MEEGAKLNEYWTMEETQPLLLEFLAAEMGLAPLSHTPFF
jgi:hypothetical protein